MFGDVPAGWAPARMGQRQMKSPNPFSGGVAALSDAEVLARVRAMYPQLVPAVLLTAENFEAKTI